MRADILITGGTIVTMDPQRRILKDHAIAVSGGTIAAIGPSDTLRADYTAEKVINAAGKYIYPGLINNHNHLFQMLFKGLGKDLRLLPWLDQCVIANYRHVNPENIYWAAVVGCMDQLHTGVTTCLDYQYNHAHPRNNDAVIRAFKDLGIRGILARGHADTTDYPAACQPPHNETTEEFLEDVRRLHTIWKDDPIIDIAAAPGIVWALSEAGFRAIADLARELDILLTIHTLETEEDNEYCLANHGLSTVELYEKTGVLDTKFLAVHCAQISEAELDKFAAHGAAISYNAISNMLVGYKTLPMCAVADRGIPTGLATDGAGSNDCNDMLEVLKISALWQKAFYRDPTVMPAMKILEMATCEGAKAIHKEHEIGSLETGKRADLFIYNPMNCTTAPSLDPITSLVYNASRCGVETTLVEGKVVLENGRVLGLDEETAVRRLQEDALLIRQKEGLPV